MVGWMQSKVTKMLQHFQITMSVLPNLVAFFSPGILYIILSILSRLHEEPKRLTYKQTGGGFPGGENAQSSILFFHPQTQLKAWVTWLCSYILKHVNAGVGC